MTRPPSVTKSSRGFNRTSVQGAIKALQTALKRYKSIPENGIAFFAGVQPIPLAEADASSSERERLLVREIEPLKPLRTGLYHCDGRFHTEPLMAQLSEEITYGFVVMDGAGCHMYRVAGDSFSLVWKHGDPCLPKKHGRGGQSAPRFGRLRSLARAAWVSKVATQLNLAFIDKNTGNVNVEAIVLCGFGELKQQLQMRTNVLENRVQAAIMPTLIDVQYGGALGIQEAIKKAAPLLETRAFTHQRGVMVKFMEDIANDTGLVAYGPVDTMFALEQGAVERLFLSEALEVRRVAYRHTMSNELVIEYIKEDAPLPPSPPSEDAHVQAYSDGETSSAPAFLDFFDVSVAAPSSSAEAASSSAAPSSVRSGTTREWHIESVEPLLDYLVRIVGQIGAKVDLISTATTQGAQFNAAFGGLGATLRWTLVLPSAEAPEDVDSDGGYDFSDM